MKLKKVMTTNYNYILNKENGEFYRWGKTHEEDPSYSPLGPEIADIEISTICHGINNRPCSFCYKSNTGRGENMSLETFKVVLDKVIGNLTQVALGIGDINSNPDLWAIMEHCRERDIVPNITINGWNLTDRYADRLVKLCGAVSVSHYDDNICFDAVKKLTSRGLKQVNIHQLVADETFGECIYLMNSSKNNERLKDLNAIVFLALKPKGKRNTYHSLPSDKYKILVTKALEDNIGIGFDSCSAPMFLNAVRDHKSFEHFKTIAEPCESYLFSIYINTRGETVPCSFLEDEEIEPIDLKKCDDFLEEVWYNPQVSKFRKNLIKTSKNCSVEGCRMCPVFDIYDSQISEPTCFKKVA